MTTLSESIAKFIHDYQVVEIDGKNPEKLLIKVKAGEEKEESICHRFSDYFMKISSLSKDLPNLVESKEMKACRPFLLAHEVAGTSLAIGSVSRRIGRKGGKKLNIGNKELSKCFTASAPMPNINKYITQNKIFLYQGRYVVENIVTTSTTIPTFYSSNFQLGTLNDAANLIAVFDQYRITEVEIWVFPKGMGTVGAVGVPMNMYHSVIDYDDSAALSSLNEALDYENCVSVPASEGIYRKWRPHVAVATYAGAFTSYGNVIAPWIDAASYTVQHYGAKFAWMVSNSAAQYDMDVRLTVEFRNVR